ncbi:tyrosine--tRNA ligase [Balneatrix alpica]|uniref:Tyrosine--tRNA ligase n=1 Tax=Balneatrix alpica TaxID=75684 RepID=A0ABV5ZDR8_9GAMM|nr:tyrosine--tRNA ligase [Balneatrix alpica]
MSSALIEDLKARGLIAQMTSEEELMKHLAEGSRTLYCGFDPTADSLHLGHLVPLLMLRRFQMAGHTPIALVGGATGLIGDPSFKAQERKLNTSDVVAMWAERLKAQLSRFIDFNESANAARLVNNLDWTAEVDVLTFLRDIGKHFSVNQMIAKESVKQRIERDDSGISFTEFTYMILQSYDFQQLNKMYDCTLQVGGSDQWGNITGGIDLTRRMNAKQVFGLTVPLITKADGTKFGKTESGAVWLDPKKTSPYAFYQFWINTADADVYRFLKFFTFLSVEEINAIEAADAQVQGRRSAQGVLAREVTRMVHGDEGLASAERISQAMFSGELSDLTEADFEQLAQDGMPSTEVHGDSIALLDALVETGLALTPRGEVTVGQARKFVEGNAVTVNGEKENSVERVLSPSEALYGRYFVLKRGKKNIHLLRWA